MAIDLFELWEELSGTINTQQGGHVRPDRNFTQWSNSASLALYEEKFAAWEKSQKIVDDMSKPFLKSVNLQVSPESTSSGIAPFPPDYAHFSSARYFTLNDKVVPLATLETYDCCGKLVDRKGERPPFIDDQTWQAMQSEQQAASIHDQAATIQQPGLVEVTIDLVDNSRWGAVLTHRRNGPKLSKPKMTQFDKGYRVAPAGVTMIVLDYLRLPVPATFEYTVAAPDEVTGRGEYLIYNRLISKPLEWSPLVRNEILTRLEKKYGKYIREDFIWQTSESDRKQTV